MDERIATMLREVERNEPSIDWRDVQERLQAPRISIGDRRRWPTIAVALSLAVASLMFLAVAIRPYGYGAAMGERPGPILFDYRRTIDTSDVSRQQSQIWSVEPDGSQPRLLFDVPEAYDDEAVWSPDGSQILFTSFTPERQGGVFVMDVDGGQMRQVLPEFACGSLAWFPDGRNVLCGGGPWKEAEDGSNELADDGVWRVHLETGDATKLLDGGYTDPAVSPDGSRIVVVGVTEETERRTVSELFVANVDGSGSRQLTFGGDGHYGEVAWSPDGSDLAASWEAVDGVLAFDIVLVSVADGSSRHLTNWEGWDGSPIWSPDGSRIAFMSDRTADPSDRERWMRMGSGPFEQSVFVMDSDGSDERLVFQGEDFAAPTSWGR
jgi:Tol biopolymer transport system component